MNKLKEIIEKLKIDDKYIEFYGKDKAKISGEIAEKGFAGEEIDETMAGKISERVTDEKNQKKGIEQKSCKKGKIILVTSINPTPLGEGKTTAAIGITDALSKLNKNVILTLREPSLGPVFGIKGGATGGGKSKIIPEDDINLHFTGDMHAITTANNLLSAMIDNHIFHGNELDIQKVVWKRCLDLNDRALRDIIIKNTKDGKTRNESFTITAASEIMAIVCLAENEEDLKKRLGNIIIGYNSKGEEIKASKLKAEGAMVACLKEAIKPNLVQTLEGSPVIVHGGPFANIAHGCNSKIALKTAINLADYVVTEAGFGADLGAEKYLDILARDEELIPKAIVIVATLKALKYHGGASKEDCEKPNKEALIKGLKNLEKHIKNIKKYNINPIVAINKFDTDTEEEISLLQDKLANVTNVENQTKLNQVQMHQAQIKQTQINQATKNQTVEVSLLENYEKGGLGAIDLAQKIILSCDKYNAENDEKIEYAYNLEDGIKEKIYKVASKIYGAKDVEYTKEAEGKMQTEDYSKYPICIAKTQYSFSDDPKMLEYKEEFTFHVKDIWINAGAGFIVVIAGNIMTMPGLPKHPAAENIDLQNGKIVGIF